MNLRAEREDLAASTLRPNTYVKPNVTWCDRGLSPAEIARMLKIAQQLAILGPQLVVDPFKDARSAFPRLMVLIWCPDAQI